MAKIKPEFDRRGVKIIGLSVDSESDHEAWARDIEETQGEDVIIAGSVSDGEAKETYPEGWKSPKPYIRIVPQP